jgi:nucleoside-diphosphate-sugar epimerase
MSGALLVTGATGLVGANVCLHARAREETVRALVRDGSDAGALEALGVEVVRGDLLDSTALRRAIAGCDRVVHCAAALSGTWSTFTPQEFHDINYGGTVAVLDAAAAAASADEGDGSGDGDRGGNGDGVRVCLLSTTGFLARGAGDPITERTPPAPPRAGEMAYAASKREAFLEGKRRAEQGQAVTTVFPGAIYGPSPVVARALADTSFNAAIVKAVRGELPRYPPVKLGWVLAADVAAVALGALEHGAPGESFLALGRQDDAMTIPEFLTAACRLAGTGHTVQATGSADEDPALLEEFGAMARTAGTRWPEPLFDASWTHGRLADEPTAVADGLALTLAWLRAAGALEPAPA